MIFTNDISPVLFSAGPVEVRWYGLFFATGLALNYLLLTWLFKKEKHPQGDLDSMVIYLFIGLVVGARLGEVLFYDPSYFFNNPLDIFKIWEGGLSSHGATIGLLTAYLIWLKVHEIKFSKYADLLVLPIPLTAAFVRLGNFFNSEIVGLPTDGNFGVVFRKLGEDFPRHPAQLYEGILLLIIFPILFFTYKKYYHKAKPLFFLFLFLALYFGGRFITEFWKDLQGPIENLPITMGQLLSSIPLAIALIYFAGYGKWRKA